MKKVVLGCMVALFAMVFAAPALASSADDPGGSGWLELCKYSDATGPVTGPFTFAVTDASGSTQTVTVQTGTCTAPFEVAAGTATVTENAVPFATVTGISTIPGDRLISSDLSSGTAEVTVVPGDISTTTTVNYTNKEVTGFIEVCKQAAAGTGLTGSFQFTITGAMGFTDTVSVPVGACSDLDPGSRGSGRLCRETGDPRPYVVDITVQADRAHFHRGPICRRQGDDGHGSGRCLDRDDRDVHQQPVGAEDLQGGRRRQPARVSFPFIANGTSLSVPAGSPPGGTCEVRARIFRAGTQWTSPRAWYRAPRASSITVNPPDRKVPDSLGTAPRTVERGWVRARPSSPTERPALPGTLKICKTQALAILREK